MICIHIHTRKSNFKANVAKRKKLVNLKDIPEFFIITATFQQIWNYLKLKLAGKEVPPMYKLHTIVRISLQHNNYRFRVKGKLNLNTCWQMVLSTYLAYSLKLAVSMEMLFPQDFEFCEAAQISSAFPSRRRVLMVKSSFFKELTLLLPILASPK